MAIRLMTAVVSLLTEAAGAPDVVLSLTVGVGPMGDDLLVTEIPPL